MSIIIDTLYIYIYIYIYTYMYVYIYIYTYIYIYIYIYRERERERMITIITIYVYASRTGQGPQVTSAIEAGEGKLAQSKASGAEHNVATKPMDSLCRLQKSPIRCCDKAAIATGQPPAHLLFSLIGGNHLSNTTCLTHFFFKRD